MVIVQLNARDCWPMIQAICFAHIHHDNRTVPVPLKISIEVQIPQPRNRHAYMHMREMTTWHRARPSVGGVQHENELIYKQICDRHGSRRNEALWDFYA